MKLVVLIFTLVYFNGACAQKKPIIDTSNYYDYLSHDARVTSWLWDYDAIPIIVEEMKKAGFDAKVDASYELSSKDRIVVSVYSSKGDFGFIYEGGHFGDIEKEHRGLRSYVALTYDEGYEYVGSYYTKGGIEKDINVKRLPDNIYLIKETVYWHQYDDMPNDNDALVTKNDILNVLRQDVLKCLSEVKAKK